MEVPVRELRDKLSKYLRLVGQGEPIVITSHHKPIAVLNPLPRLDEPGLQEMIASGTVKWNGKRVRIDPERPGAAIRGHSIAETVLEDRE
jgi:prevent-host-death family protein